MEFDRARMPHTTGLFNGRMPPRMDIPPVRTDVQERLRQKVADKAKAAADKAKAVADKAKYG